MRQLAGDADLIVGFTIYGMRTYSLANQREHWHSKSDRARKEKLAVRAHCQHERIPPPRNGQTVVVTLTRVGPVRMDSDNAIGSLKHVRDGIAEWLGLDDGDEERIVFKYQREKGPYAVRVELVIA